MPKARQRPPSYSKPLTPRNSCFAGYPYSYWGGLSVTYIATLTATYIKRTYLNSIGRPLTRFLPKVGNSRTDKTLLFFHVWLSKELFLCQDLVGVNCTIHRLVQNKVAKQQMKEPLFDQHKEDSRFKEMS